MDPNSKNQLWSRWAWTVRPGRSVVLPFEPVKLVLANHVRSLFGSAGQMRITEKLDHYIIDLRIEGRPAHDPDFVAHIKRKMVVFFIKQFGPTTTVTMTPPKIEAGSRQDGSPPDQLIILPSLRLGSLLKG